MIHHVVVNVNTDENSLMTGKMVIHPSTTSVKEDHPIQHVIRIAALRTTMYFHSGIINCVYTLES